MANKKDEQPGSDLLRTSRFSKLASNIQANISKLYKTTFYADDSNKSSRELIVRDIDYALDNIMSSNSNASGEQNVSRLLKRLHQEQKSPDTIKAFEKMFDDKQLMGSILTSYSNNRYLYDYDAEIDTICKYMPKLQEALNTKRDNVLTTDHFSRDFITASNLSDITNGELFSKRLDELKDQYKLLEKIEKWYDDTAKYGETFIYIVPYSKAFKDLMDDKKNPENRMQSARMNFENGQFITESATTELPIKLKNIQSRVLKSLGSLEIELDKSGRLSSYISEMGNMVEKMSSVNESSMAALFESSLVLEEKPVAADSVSDDAKSPIALDGESITTKKSKKLKDKNSLVTDMDVNKYLKDIDKDATSSDGFIDYTTPKESSKTTKFKIPGCIIKTIDRHNIIPIYIDEDICLGYYYFEFQSSKDFGINNAMRLSDPMLTMQPGNDLNSETDQGERDKALRYISSELSKFIDGEFINANQDIKREIYAILKHNQLYNNPNPNKMKVTFLPPEDVEHMYFRKDAMSNRGISDLHESLLPAKLFSAMYISNSIMSMTRGYDKRVYYINPGIETNITQAMLTVVDQIKKSNFGLRQIRNNLNHVLNIQGAFNDYIIPKSPNGDAPISMEVLQGQNVEVKTDLMNLLEEMAINATEVPVEIIQTRQNSMDYAIQLTMSSSKFLRVSFKRQAKCNETFGRILTRIYNYHFRQKDTISFELPPPSFLNITNTTQFFDNLNNYATHMAEIEFPKDDDQAGKAIFIKELKKIAAGSFYNKDLVAIARRKAEQQKALIGGDDQNNM